MSTALKPNHYDVLGIDGDASDEDIKKAYRTLALAWHPVREMFLFSQGRNSQPVGCVKPAVFKNATLFRHVAFESVVCTHAIQWVLDICQVYISSPGPGCSDV